MIEDLTPRQRQVLIFIQDTLAEHGLPPTRAEIAEALGFKSANAAEEHLRALQRKGVLELRPGASRGIQLKDSLREQMGLPLIGRVAAGRIGVVTGWRGERLPLGAQGDVPGDLIVGEAGELATVEAWKVRALAFAGFLLGSLILAATIKRLAPELLGRFGGSVPSLGGIMALLAWLAASVTAWLLFRPR